MANPSTRVVGQYSSLSNPLTSVNFFPAAIGGSTRLTIAAPADISEGKMLFLRCVMKITGGTTTNFTPSLYFWNNANTDLTTTTGDIVLFTPSAFAVNSTTNLWALEGIVIWNGTLGSFTGNICGMQHATLIGLAAMSNLPVTAASINRVQFCCGGFFSATNAGNIVTLADFSIDQM